MKVLRQAFWVPLPQVLQGPWSLSHEGAPTLWSPGAVGRADGGRAPLLCSHKASRPCGQPGCYPHSVDRTWRHTKSCSLSVGRARIRTHLRDAQAPSSSQMYRQTPGWLSVAKAKTEHHKDSVVIFFIKLNAAHFKDCRSLRLCAFFCEVIGRGF